MQAVRTWLVPEKSEQADHLPEVQIALLGSCAEIHKQVTIFVIDMGLERA